MSRHTKHTGETSHRLAAVFYHNYDNMLTRAECPNCENHLKIEKQAAIKDIGLRFWRVFIRSTNGEVYLPLKEMLFGGLFEIHGFIIVNTSGGEDMLRCCKCGDMFFVWDVNDELDVVLHEGFDEMAEQRRKEAENEFREEINQQRPTEKFILPDGNLIGSGVHCVAVKHSRLDEEEAGFIHDILKIEYRNDYISIESICDRHVVQMRTLLYRFEELDGSTLIRGWGGDKKEYAHL